MLKEFAWKAFEDTGNIDAYVFYREIEASKRQVSLTMIAEGEVASSKQK